MPEFTVTGRGAWNSKGVGGTLTRSGGKTVPGRWYMATDAAPKGADPSTDQRIQIHVFRQLRFGQRPTLNDLAVFLGAKALQKLLGFDEKGQDGIIGPLTDGRIRDKQRELKVTVDGLVGPATMRAMLTPIIHDMAKKYDVRWQILCGKLHNEGNWDPGAVGGSDPYDWGLSQINIRSHPQVSAEQAYDPHFALDFGAKFMRQNLDEFNGNERDAIAAYNLGAGGTRQWTNAGRPDVWTPPWTKTASNPEGTPRNVKQYIDRILSSCS